MRRNCLLKHAVEGKIEGRLTVKGRRRGRRKQLLDELKVRKGYWKLKEEALDRTPWRTRFGIGCGPFVRQTTRMNGLKEKLAVSIKRDKCLKWERERVGSDCENEKKHVIRLCGSRWYIRLPLGFKW